MAFSRFDKKVADAVMSTKRSSELKRQLTSRDNHAVNLVMAALFCL